MEVCVLTQEGVANERSAAVSSVLDRRVVAYAASLCKDRFGFNAANDKQLSFAKRISPRDDRSPSSRT